MSPAPQPPFAGLVRERMRERGIGLRELCRAVRLDPSFFSKVLAGKRSPPSEEAVLRRIAEALAMDASALVVSAGRIPMEWSGVWKDPGLFESMHRLALRGVQAPVRQAASSWSTGPERKVAKAKAFGDELL